MKQHARNGWFHASELPRLIGEMHHAATTEHDRHLSKNCFDCKYIELRIDQRTGDFIVKNAQGHVVSAEKLMIMFPELRPPEIVAAGVRPYPE